MRSIQFVGLGLCLASAIAAGPANAVTWPANIVGTYAGLANSADIEIIITSQASAAPCSAITGSLVDTDQNITNPIAGYYCPKSGALAFTRSDPTSGQTFQVYTGSFEATAKKQSNKLAGAFGEYGDASNLGLYPFFVNN